MSPRRIPHRFGLTVASCAVVLTTVPACTLTPSETKDERARLEQVGKDYEPRFEDRTLPEIPAQPTWRDILRRTFLANGDLEASYFRWKIAMERVDAAGAYPNTDVQVGYSYLFSGDRMSAFDRSTFTIGFDPAKNLVLPMKTQQAALVALDAARVAGDKFRVEMFDLQRKSMYAWADYKKQSRMVDVKRELADLRKIETDLVGAKVAAGGSRPEALRAQIAMEESQSALLDAQAEQRSMRAMLNGLMGREPGAELGLPAADEDIPPLTGDDAALIASAADVFPEVTRFADEVRGRQDGLELARMRWIPDISPTIVFSGGISQAVGLAITLPTTIAEIRAGINEAEAGIREAEAILRQRRADRVAEYFSLIVVARNAQRRVEFFDRTIGPAAGGVSDMQSRAYAAGQGTFSDLVESKRMSLEASEAAAEARAVYERAMVEIACCLGVGLDSVGEPPPPHTLAPPANPEMDHGSTEAAR